MPNELDMSQLEKQITQFKWVNGMGLALENGVETILIYTSKKNISKNERDKLPNSFDGYPIKLKYLGKIVAK